MESVNGNEIAYRKAENSDYTAWRPFTYQRNEFSSKSSSPEAHLHAGFEIDYVVGGTLRFGIGDQEFLGKKGDIFIIHPNEVHTVSPVGPKPVGAYHSFLFSTEFLSGSISERCYAEILLPILRGKKKIASPVTELHPYYCEIQISMDNIIAGLQEDTSLHDLMIKSELIRIFYFLLQYESGRRQPASQAIPAEIYAALKYIAQNYSEKISTHDLSQLSFLSDSRFLTVFKQTVGTSPTHYINQIRLKNACQMLSDTDATVINIANACGFNNISNFNVQFKKLVGMSPLDYRSHSRSAKRTGIGEQPGGESDSDPS